MAQSTPAQHQAAKDLEGILALKRRPEFVAYMERMKAHFEKAEEKLGTDQFATPGDLWNARKKVDGMREMLGFFEQEEKTCRNLLGLGPDQAPDIL